VGDEFGALVFEDADGEEVKVRREGEIELADEAVDCEVVLRVADGLGKLDAVVEIDEEVIGLVEDAEVAAVALDGPIFDAAEGVAAIEAADAEEERVDVAVVVGRVEAMLFVDRFAVEGKAA
jgi:hypothetical protein